MEPKLDRTDLKILRLLQSDGRMGNAEIAKRVNTSAATCHRRIQRLFAEGYVTGSPTAHREAETAKAHRG